MEAIAEQPVHLTGIDMDALRAWVVAGGRPRFRAGQIAQWVFEKKVESFDEMTNLSKADRAWLAGAAAVRRSVLTRESVARDGTTKLLLTWPDGASVETVWIPERERHTVCVSSQVGCPVGCRFCASGIDGVVRDLTAGEIVEQAVRVAGMVERANRAATGRESNQSANGATNRAATVRERSPGGADVPRATAPLRSRLGSGGRSQSETDRGSSGADGPTRLTNVVLMGMGEPLANYDNVVRAIRIMNAPWGLGIGARRITLSTVGLPKQIRRLATEGLQINLALSLHAPEDKLREELIPWGKVPIAELIDACGEFFRQTGREVTLEYVLLAGVNDLPRHADGLARIGKRLRCNVNLLRYNPVPGLPYERPSAEAAFDFQRRLRAGGVNAHVRTSRGTDIDAACGQLRRKQLNVVA